MKHTFYIGRIFLIMQVCVSSIYKSSNFNSPCSRRSEFSTEGITGTRIIKGGKGGDLALHPCLAIECKAWFRTVNFEKLSYPRLGDQGFNNMFHCGYRCKAEQVSGYSLSGKILLQVIGSNGRVYVPAAKLDWNGIVLVDNNRMEERRIGADFH